MQTSIDKNPVLFTDFHLSKQTKNSHTLTPNSLSKRKPTRKCKEILTRINRFVNRPFEDIIWLFVVLWRHCCCGGCSSRWFGFAFLAVAWSFLLIGIFVRIFLIGIFELKFFKDKIRAGSQYIRITTHPLKQHVVRSVKSSTNQEFELFLVVFCISLSAFSGA
jgi:hypothetical protein